MKFLQDTYVQVEDEAALINQHLNSMKRDPVQLKKQASRLNSQYSFNKLSSGKISENSGSNQKTMLELIQESILEEKNRKQALIKKLDFSSLVKTLDQSKVEQTKLTRFKYFHYDY